MREIKFRGKNEGVGWLYGNYYYGDGFGGKHLIQVKRQDGTHLSWCVDPETVGQFTGLKDKNGTEIYEGDILTWVNNSGKAGDDLGIVKFGTFDIDCNGREYSFMIHGWYVCPIENEEFGDVNSAESLTCDLIEGHVMLIGNFYENPELLQG